MHLQYTIHYHHKRKGNVLRLPHISFTLSTPKQYKCKDILECSLKFMDINLPKEPMTNKE